MKPTSTSVARGAYCGAYCVRAEGGHHDASLPVNSDIFQAAILPPSATPFVIWRAATPLHAPIESPVCCPRVQSHVSQVSCPHLVWGQGNLHSFKHRKIHLESHSSGPTRRGPLTLCTSFIFFRRSRARFSISHCVPFCARKLRPPTLR